METTGKKKVLIISPEAWGTNFVSKHLYATNLAETNTVYFLNPAIGSTLWQWFNFRIEKKNVEENLVVVSYKNVLPKLDKWPRVIQKYFFKRTAKKIQKLLEPKGFDVVWSFDPFRFFDYRGWQTNCKIYHTVDFHPSAKFEGEIIAHADYIFTVSDWISRELPLNGKSAIKFNHGADVKNFDRALQSGRTVSIPGHNKYKATYIGNFHQRIDYPLLIKLITENPTVDFLLIGPVTVNNLGKGNHITERDLVTLRGLSNAYFIGAVPSADIILYLQSSDINLVLFHESMRKTQCNTHKLMVYFYSGKAVISSDIYEYRNADADLLKLCINNTDIPAAFKEVLTNLDFHNSPDKMVKRKKFALQNSYPNLIKKIGTIISVDI